MSTSNTYEDRKEFLLTQFSFNLFLLDLFSTVGIEPVRDLGEVTHRPYGRCGGKDPAPRLDSAIDPSALYQPGQLPGQVEKKGAAGAAGNSQRHRGIDDLTLGIVCKATSPSLTVSLPMHTGMLDDNGEPLIEMQSVTSVKVNSWRVRKLKAEPILGMQVTLYMKVREFEFPPLREGGKPRFRYEQVPDVTFRYGRETYGVAEEVERVSAMASSGWKALAILQEQMNISHSTIIRRIRLYRPDMDFSLYTKIAIDEFAIRKGQVYCTIIVDLVSHEIIDIIFGRTCEEVLAALGKFPNLQVMTRDRSASYGAAAKSYSEEKYRAAYGKETGILSGEELKIVDRIVKEILDSFHLAKDLNNAISKDMYDYKEEALRQLDPATAPEPETPEGKSLVLMRIASPAPTQLKKDQFDAVHNEMLNGVKNAAQIARKTGISEATVRKLMKMDKPKASKEFTFSDYECYLQKVMGLMKEGLEPGDIYDKCKDAGMKGGENGFHEWRRKKFPTYTRTLRRQIREGKVEIYFGDTSEQHMRDLALMNTTELRYMLCSTYTEEDLSRMSEKQRARVLQFEDLFKRSEVLNDLHTIAAEFGNLFKSGKPEDAKPFLEKLQNGKYKHVAKWATTLLKEQPAFEEGIRTGLTNALAEGKNNLVKAVKRGLFGRCTWVFLFHKIMMEQEYMRDIKEQRNKDEARRKANREARALP